MEETMKSYSRQPQAVARRKSALTRLEAQLKAGTKPVEGKQIPLTDDDRSRIEKEIEILKTRI